MTDPVPNLWPKIRPSRTVTPLGILRGQAESLRRQTSGLLEGEVVTDGVGDDLSTHFNIVAPALGHYRFPLFTMRHGLEPYPVILQPSAQGSHPGIPMTLSTHEELVQWLRKELASDRTRSVLERLWTESLPDGEPADALEPVK